MNENNPLVVIAILIVGLIVLISARNILNGNIDFANSADNSNSLNVPINTANTPSINENGEQIVTLKYEDYKYQLYPSTFVKGVPVRMEVDLSTVTGCMTAVRIPGFGVAKSVKPGDNIITFTPDKTGTFQIACSMGMGRNTFTVVDDSGSAGTFVEAPVAGGSCGSGGGGCGCGGGA